MEIVYSLGKKTVLFLYVIVLLEWKSGKASVNTDSQIGANTRLVLYVPLRLAVNHNISDTSCE